MTHHAAVAEVLTDPATYAKDPKHWTAWRQGRIPRDSPFISWIAPENMLTRDGEHHRRLRGLVSQAFTARQIEQLRPRVSAATGGLLERMRRLDTRPVDLKAEFTLALPLMVISDLFGVPEAGRGHMERLCSQVFDQTITPEQAASTHQQLQDFVADLVGAKRRRPSDDLTSRLLGTREAVERLSETELVWTLILFLGAGHQTTVDLLSNAAIALLTRPGQLQMLRDRRVPWSAAVEETLRRSPSIASLPFRYTTRTAELGGTSIPAGEAVLLCLAAAGRDPAAYGPDADSFDITRPPVRHLALGHGVHFCLGAPLARMEAEIALESLFTTFPDLALAVPAAQLQPLPSIIADAVAQIPVTYTSHTSRQPTGASGSSR